MNYNALQDNLNELANHLQHLAESLSEQGLDLTKEETHLAILATKQAVHNMIDDVPVNQTQECRDHFFEHFHSSIEDLRILTT